MANFIWESKLTGGHDSKNVNIIHEYIICYTKNSNGVDILNKRQSNTEYPNFDKKKKQYFKWDSLWTVSHGYAKNCDYAVLSPDGSKIAFYSELPQVPL